MRLTAERAAKAARAVAYDAERFPAHLRVVTDTRTLVPGDTFLALRGERFDGHAYVREALERGAVALVVDDPQACIAGVPTLLVRDTLRAYMDLAGAAREQFEGRVVAITGSAGKTTTKHLLAQLLAARYGEARVLASPANENNEIGVSKLLLAAGAHDVVVVEMGARRYGDVAALVEIAKPHLGVLTNVGEAHLEIVGSRERLAETKWALFAGGARAVLNAQDEVSLSRAASLPDAPAWFGIGEPTRAGTFVVDERTLSVERGAQTLRVPIDARLPGAHNRRNLAAAIAAALACGCGIEELAEATKRLTLPSGRYDTIAIAGGPRIIYDAYNASMSGTMATLDAFALESGGRRIAVLGSMAELGDEAASMHERVGEHAAASNLDMLLVGGDFAGALAAGARRAGLEPDRIVAFAANDDAVAWLREHAGPSDVVLLKGSRVYRLEEIVEGLKR